MRIGDDRSGGNDGHIAQDKFKGMGVGGGHGCGSDETMIDFVHMLVEKGGFVEEPMGGIKEYFVEEHVPGDFQEFSLPVKGRRFNLSVGI